MPAVLEGASPGLPGTEFLSLGTGEGFLTLHRLATSSSLLVEHSRDGAEPHQV